MSSTESDDRAELDLDTLFSLIDAVSGVSSDQGVRESARHQDPQSHDKSPTQPSNVHTPTHTDSAAAQANANSEGEIMRADTERERAASLLWDMSASAHLTTQLITAKYHMTCARVIASASSSPTATDRLSELLLGTLANFASHRSNREHVASQHAVVQCVCASYIESDDTHCMREATRFLSCALRAQENGVVTQCMGESNVLSKLVLGVLPATLDTALMGRSIELLYIFSYYHPHTFAGMAVAHDMYLLRSITHLFVEHVDDMLAADLGEAGNVVANTLRLLRHCVAECDLPGDARGIVKGCQSVLERLIRDMEASVDVLSDAVVVLHAVIGAGAQLVQGEPDAPQSPCGSGTLSQDVAQAVFNMVCASVEASVLGEEHSHDEMDKEAEAAAAALLMRDFSSLPNEVQARVMEVRKVCGSSSMSASEFEEPRPEHVDGSGGGSAAASRTQNAMAERMCALFGSGDVSVGSVRAG